SANVCPELAEGKSDVLNPVRYSRLSVLLDFHHSCIFSRKDCLEQVSTLSSQREHQMSSSTSLWYSFVFTSTHAWISISVEPQSLHTLISESSGCLRLALPSYRLTARSTSFSL